MKYDRLYQNSGEQFRALIDAVRFGVLPFPFDKARVIQITSVFTSIDNSIG